MRKTKERIKELRRALGLTQDAFGKQIGLSQNYIWMVEKGDRTFGDRVIDDICDLYNVNRLWLDTGEGDMFRALSRDDEILRFANSLVKPSEDAEKQEKIRSFISSVSQLSYDEWEVLYKIAKNWVDKNENA